MPSSNNGKPQQTSSSQGDCIKLESDMKKHEYIKEEVLGNEPALSKKEVFINLEKQKKPEAVDWDLKNTVDEELAKRKLNRENSPEEKCQVDTECYAEEESFANGVAGPQFKKTEPNNLSEYPAAGKDCTTKRQRKKVSKANGNIAEVSNSKCKAMLTKKITPKEVGHYPKLKKESTKEYKRKDSMKGNTADVPFWKVRTPKVLKKSMKNNHDSRKSQNRMNTTGKKDMSKDSTPSSENKTMIKSGHYGISARSNDNIFYSNGRKPKPLSKGKDSDSSKNLLTKNISSRDEIEADVDLKVTKETVASQVGEHDKVSSPSSSSSSERNVFRITRTKGQIELFNTKDEQKGDLDESTVYVGKLPKDVDIHEIHAIFQKAGNVESVRLMLNRETGACKTFAFVTFIETQDAKNALQKLSNYEIRQNENIIVNPAKENKRLFVGNICKSMSRDDVFREFSAITHGLRNAITYKSINGTGNRGFCFLEYESHRSASRAKTALTSMTTFSYPLMVDWADSTEEPSDEVMAAVKRVYLTNLSPRTSEDVIRDCFEAFGAVERVKKIKNFAFVHFEERRCALDAIEKMNGSVLDGEMIKVMLSKPPIKKSVTQLALRNRELRMTRTYAPIGIPKSKFPKSGIFRALSQSSQFSLHQQEKSPRCLQYPPRPYPFSGQQDSFHANGWFSLEPVSQQHHPPPCSSSLEYYASAPSTFAFASPAHPDLHDPLPGSPPICSAPGCSAPICPKGNEPFCCRSFH